MGLGVRPTHEHVALTEISGAPLALRVVGLERLHVRVEQVEVIILQQEGVSTRLSFEPQHFGSLLKETAPLNSEASLGFFVVGLALEQLVDVRLLS